MPAATGMYGQLIEYIQGWFPPMLLFLILSSQNRLTGAMCSSSRSAVPGLLLHPAHLQHPLPVPGLAKDTQQKATGKPIQEKPTCLFQRRQLAAIQCLPR